MLVPDQMVEVKINSSNKKHFEGLGYIVYISHKNPCFISVPVEHLLQSSNIKIKVICDYCYAEFKKTFAHYNNSKTKFCSDKDCCSKCQSVKTKETNMIKYGVDSPMKLDNVKEKTKQTNLDKYGVEYHTQSEQTKNKIIETFQTKYGVDQYMKTDDFIEKSKQTNLDKYGTENANSSEEIKTKKKNTMLTKYGVGSLFEYEPFKENYKETSLKRYGTVYPVQSDEVKDKIKASNFNKYGVEYSWQADEIKEKIRQTNLMKYGVVSYRQTKEYTIKAIETSLQKYGTKYVLSSPIIRKKINDTLIRNGTCKTSSQQIELHKMIQEEYLDAIINYPCGNNIFDIALILDNDIKIDIEYDCWYWHKDQERDKRRDYYHIRRGWKVLRVKSGMKLPSKQELFDAIDYLKNTEHCHKYIILDDWKEPNKEISA